MRSYYKTNAPNQMKGIMTNPTFGLNEYNSSVSISDNHLSDVLDVEPYRDNALLMYSKQSITAGLLSGSNLDGIVYSSIALQGDDENYASLVQNNLTKQWYVRKSLIDANATYSSLINNSLFPGANLIKNGNFERLDAFTNNLEWDFSDCSQPSVVSNVASFTATAQYGGIEYPDDDSYEIPISTGRKYYIAAKMLSYASGSTEMKITLYNGTGADSVTTIGYISMPSSSNIVVFSHVLTTSSDHQNIKVRLEDKKTSAWQNVDVYYCEIIDVTHETGLSDVDIDIKYDALGFLPEQYDLKKVNFSNCNFSLEEKTYTCFACDFSKKLVYYDADSDYVNSSVNEPVSLPFYPKKILSHSNRIFAIDTFNKLWWCRVGDLFSWYSMEYDDDRLMASSDMQATAYTLTGIIDVTRPVTATIFALGASDTYGSLYIVGTNSLDEVQSEIIALALGRNQSLKSYKTITSVTTPDWVTSGTTDKILFGVAPVGGGYVQDDAGFWTIEREKSLTDITVMNDNVYIFAPDNIYIFSGYSPENFTLATIIANMGIKEYIYPRHWLTTINNISYFYNNGEIYEFDGSSYPRIISRQVNLNGSLQNGVSGGIAPLTTSYSLASDNDNLYIYDSTTLLFDDNKYYVFNTDTRVWFKKTGFSKNNSIYSATAFSVMYIVKKDTDSIISIVSVASASGSFNFHYDLGHLGLYSPYLITKAYNSNPSELGSLTSIILEVKGTNAATSDIVLYYSLTTDGAFTEFKRYTAYTFNGDIQIIDTPVPISIIANAHHYRLKIESTGSMYLFNIERRFRIRGRSR